MLFCAIQCHATVQHIRSSEPMLSDKFATFHTALLYLCSSMKQFDHQRTLVPSLGNVWQLLRISDHSHSNLIIVPYQVLIANNLTDILWPFFHLGLYERS